MLQHRSQTFVELLQRLVGGFERRADEVRRNALPAAFELTLVEEAQTGRQVGDDGRGFVHRAFEGRGRPRLVMVLHEARELRLVVEPGVEMLPHRPGVTVAEPIVQPLVVGVVETLLLHGPFKIPIDLRHEAEARNLLAHAPVASGQKSGARRPQVRSKTSGSTSMAMSHRTPSHCPAILRSSPTMASCVAGLL